MADLTPVHNTNYLQHVADEDVRALKKARESYGDSWKQRGGVGAYMMLARKMDRMENQVKKAGYDVFQAFANDTRQEGIIDDIRDLRRYLMLVESELIARGELPQPPILSDAQQRMKSDILQNKSIMPNPFSTDLGCE
jgi:hypothetical protein